MPGRSLRRLLLAVAVSAVAVLLAWWLWPHDEASGLVPERAGDRGATPGRRGSRRWPPGRPSMGLKPTRHSVA